MKILYLVHQFYPEYQTGTEKFILNNAKMSQKFGNFVKVITYSFYEDKFYTNNFEGILYKEFYLEGVPIVAFKYQQQPKNLNVLLHNELLFHFSRHILDIESPDLIHVGHPMRVHEFIWAAMELHIPYVITLTDFFLLCPKVNLTPDRTSLCSGPRGGIACSRLCSEFNNTYILNRLKEAKAILQNSGKIVSPSFFLTNIFQQEFNEFQFDIIHHGIQYDYIRQNNKIYHKGDPLTIGYAGSLVYHKGVHVLLRAFREIKDPNIRLVIYGSGQNSFVEELKDITNNDNRVQFKGRYSSEHLGQIFTDIDLLITPSICYETYQMVLHEALASNVPVIASDLGEMAEKIFTGLNGIKFTPGDYQDLAQKIRLVMDDITILNKFKKYINDKMIVPTIEQEAYKYFGIYLKSI